MVRKIICSEISAITVWQLIKRCFINPCDADMQALCVNVSVCRLRLDTFTGHC